LNAPIVKDVHKDPPLDLVGWWSTASPSGPDASHLPVHRQLLQDYNESALFLAFHPSQLKTDTLGAKLPLTIYETVLEGESTADGSKDMQIDGEERAMNIRFRELPYSVETGEAEMIGVDTIAKGSGTAAWTEPAAQGSNKTNKNKKESSQVELTQEEEECMSLHANPAPLRSPTSALLTRLVIANLNTRLNAIRTLESRISLIKSYVSSVTESNDPANPSSPQMSHAIIRNINSLIAHLSILSPRDSNAFRSEVLSQNNDVKLVSLLGQMGESVKAMSELGRKSVIVQGARQTRQARTLMEPNALPRNFEEDLFRQDVMGSRA
jgi:COP9 signalosome complex subunit 6